MLKRDANAYLFNETLKHRHTLLRKEQEVARDVVACLTAERESLEQQIIGLLRRARPHPDAPVDRRLVQSIKDQVRAWGMSRVAAASQLLLDRLFAIAQQEAEVQERILHHVLAGIVEEARPTVTKQGLHDAIKAGYFQNVNSEVVEEVADDYLAALEMEGDTLVSDIGNAATRGMVARETVTPIMSRIGLAMGTMMMGGERIAKTAVNDMANAVGQEMHEATSAEVPQEEFVATLDEKCCLICASLDSSIWDVDAPNKPIPPMHPNCHCYLCPTKIDWGFYGFTEPLRAAWMASNENALRFVQPGLVQVPGKVRRVRVLHRKLWRVPGNWKVQKLPLKTDYEAWFKMQPAATQKQILGPSRYDLWKSGKVGNLKGFVKEGAVIRLDELKPPPGAPPAAVPPVTTPPPAPTPVAPAEPVPKTSVVPDEAQPKIGIGRRGTKISSDAMRRMKYGQEALIKAGADPKKLSNVHVLYWRESDYVKYFGAEAKNWVAHYSPTLNEINFTIGGLRGKAGLSTSIHEWAHCLHNHSASGVKRAWIAEYKKDLLTYKQWMAKYSRVQALNPRQAANMALKHTRAPSLYALTSSKEYFAEVHACGILEQSWKTGKVYLLSEFPELQSLVFGTKA